MVATLLPLRFYIYLHTSSYLNKIVMQNFLIFKAQADEVFRITQESKEEWLELREG